MCGQPLFEINTTISGNLPPPHPATPHHTNPTQPTQLVAGTNMCAEDEMLSEIDRIPRSNLYQIAVTPKMIKDTPTYGALFTAMSEKKQTCLGLFRGIVPEKGLGPKENTLPYVPG